MLTIIRRIAADVGLEIFRERRCMFSLTSRLERFLPKGQFAFNKKWITALDDYLCRLPIRSERYHATKTCSQTSAFGLVPGATEKIEVARTRRVNVAATDSGGQRNKNQRATFPRDPLDQTETGSEENFPGANPGRSVRPMR
jgi:hypothetical protein